MITLLTSAAFAAPPFEAGPLQPLPIAPTDAAIFDGKLLLLTEASVFREGADGWVASEVRGGLKMAVSEGQLAICGADGVRTYGLDETQISTQACTDIAPVPGGFWMQGPAGVFIVPGDAPVALEGADVLAGGPEGAWVTGNRMHIGTDARLIFPGATAVSRIQSAEGVEWVLTHPERGLLGLLGSSGLESAWPQEVHAHVVAVGDLGRDGTQDIVLVGPESWVQLTDTRAPPPPPPVYARPVPQEILAAPVQPMRRPRPRPESVSIIGLKMPKFAGLEPEPDHDSLFIGGFGLVVGRPLGPNQLSVGFSPAALGGVERGTRRIRSFFGADSAPLYSWVGGSMGLHLAMATVGFTIGSDRLRAGPFVSLGLIGIGGGLRAVFTPFVGRTGKLAGFEGRLTWFYPNAGHASLYYVSAFPMGRRGKPAKNRSRRKSFCRRFGAGLGVAGGFSSTAYAWEFVGRESDYQLSWSPALTVTCDSGSKTAGWSMGGETAPFFFYRVPTNDQGADRRLNHMGSATLGLFLGGDRLRAGPIITAGIWTLGAGFRAVVAPFRTPKGVYHGLELRAVALYPSSPAGQAMAVYHIAFNPKASRSKDLIAEEPDEEDQ